MDERTISRAGSRCIGLLGLFVLRTRRWEFATLAPLLVFMLVTDALGFHERNGRALAESVAVDALHIMTVDDLAGLSSGSVFGLIEDGGEMIGTSLLVAYLFWLSLRPTAVAAPTHAPRDALVGVQE